VSLVAESKRSVVAVGTFSQLRSPRFSFSGTGFAVGDGTLIATCHHVLREGGTGTEKVGLAVQLRSDRGDPEWRAAEVVASDRARDLALLRVEGAPVPALALSSEEAEAADGAPVALIGFPIGGLLGFSHVTHRGIVSSRVSSSAPSPTAGQLSERAVAGARIGAFDVLQLDATAYPGNSGGPLLNSETGRVIGVVSMVLVKGTREAAIATPTGITYAVPSKYLVELLTKVK